MHHKELDKLAALYYNSKVKLRNFVNNQRGEMVELVEGARLESGYT